MKDNMEFLQKQNLGKLMETFDLRNTGRNLWVLNEKHFSKLLQPYEEIALMEEFLYINKAL